MALSYEFRSCLYLSSSMLDFDSVNLFIAFNQYGLVLGFTSGSYYPFTELIKNK